HLKVRERVDVDDPKPLETMESQEFKGGEDEKNCVLVNIASSTAPMGAQRNPRDSRPLDGLNAGFVLVAKADDIHVVPRITNCVDLPTDTRISREVSVGDVADSHRNAAAVAMTARQTSASNAQITRTISHSRSR